MYASVTYIGSDGIEYETNASPDDLYDMRIENAKGFITITDIEYLEG